MPIWAQILTPIITATITAGLTALVTHQRNWRCLKVNHE